MLYIIFDLEASLVTVKDIKPIVEIGAVKMEMRDNKLEIIDTFQTYVRPTSRFAIGEKTLKFIGAKQENFRAAPTLPFAMNRFKKWIGEDESYFCTWSDGDLWLLAENWCINAFDLTWLKNYNDIQSLITLYLTGGSEAVSLENALKIREVKSEGRLHSALTDSLNTSNLFISCFKDIEKELMKSDEPFKTVSTSIYRTCIQCGGTNRIHSFRKRNRCSSCRRMRRIVTHENKNSHLPI